MLGIDRIALVQDKEKWCGCCECGKEPSGFLKYMEFLDWLMTH
jgi:hypothetical protein